MDKDMLKRQLALAFFGAAVISLAGGSAAVAKGKFHPYDIYDHKMHMSLFEAAGLSCEACHADPASYGDRKKVMRTGCHICHNAPKPAMPAPSDCSMCHPDGPPRPESHKLGWMARHQVEAKADPSACAWCHKNAIFCIGCHKRRDTVKERVHKSSFRFYHSIEARANPRRCDACHAAAYCQNCHAGRGDSSK